MSEKDLLPEQKVRKVLEFAISDYFDLLPEEYFDNSRLHIDYVAICKRTGVKFGIECKAAENFKGEDISDTCFQCCEYSLMKYKGEIIPIFLYPAYSQRVLQNILIPSHNIKEGHEHSTANTIFAKNFNFGEIRQRTFLHRTADSKILKSYYEFRFGNICIYRCRDRYESGLNVNNYQDLLEKIKKWPTSSPILEISQRISHIIAQSKQPSNASATEQSAI